MGLTPCCKIFCIPFGQLIRVHKKSHEILFLITAMFYSIFCSFHLLQLIPRIQHSIFSFTSLSINPPFFIHLKNGQHALLMFDTLQLRVNTSALKKAFFVIQYLSVTSDRTMTVDSTLGCRRTVKMNNGGLTQSSTTF